jgi:hypothetical protein
MNTASASNIGPSVGLSAGDMRRLANAPWPKTILNIGHNVNGLPALDRSHVTIALYPLRHHMESHEVMQSTSEQTSVIVLDCYVDDALLLVLCEQLQQDAIAAFDTAEGTGRVVGPRASEWGGFNPDYFLMPTE